MRTRLKGFLADWQGLLTENGSAARGVLDIALRDRIRFAPDVARHEYQLTVPIGLDQVLTAIVPELRGCLQETVASPTGTKIHDLPLKGSWRSDRQAA